MATFEHDAVIASLAARAREQIGNGLACVLGGDHIAAESWLRPALATLASLQALIDGTAPAKPMRRMALVQKPSDEELQPWMETTHGEPDDGAA